MNRDDIRKLLNNLPNERYIYKLIDEVAKARPDGIGWYDFIESEALKHHGVTKLSVVPPTTSHKKRTLLDPFLDEAYECAMKGGFAYRSDPDMFLEYCHPFSDKRGKYFEELSEKQQRVIRMMHEDVLSFRKKERKQLPTDQGQSFIEDALDNAIKERVREKGSDTA